LQEVELGDECGIVHWNLTRSVPQWSSACQLDASLATAAHMAALVHGLGSIVVLHSVRDEYARQASLAPDPAVPLALLDTAGVTVARLAACWDLPGSTVLALQATEASQDPLARILQMGRQAAAVEVLVQAGAIDEHVATATLGALTKMGQRTRAFDSGAF